MAIGEILKKAKADSLPLFLLGAAVVAGPALFFGPWLPLLDTIAFSALNSFPAKQSYGPFHYYVFEFTYMLPLILCRACTDFGIHVRWQVLLFYLTEGLVAFFVVWRLITRLVENPLVRCVGCSLGALAFWDGLFLWGGPLAYSLAAAALALAAVLSIMEAEQGTADGTGKVALLCALAVVSHPFAVPFALILVAVRLVLLKRGRLRGAALLVTLLAYGVLVRIDSPEGTGGGGLGGLFGAVPRLSWSRAVSFATWDSATVLDVLGVSTRSISLLFSTFAAVRLAGFVASPVALFVARRSRAITMLAAMDGIVAVLYLFANDTNFISYWPQRILTLNSSITYAAGVVLPYVVVKSLMGREPLGRHSIPRRTHLLCIILPFVISMALVNVQIPVMRLGPAIRVNYRTARQALLEMGLHDSTVYCAGFGNIHPNYLRCIPFLLFSDSHVLARNLVLVTEWHSQPRHPSRVAERELDKAGFGSVRVACGVNFAMKDGMVIARQGDYSVDRTLRIDSWSGLPRGETGWPILTTGHPDDGNFVYAVAVGRGLAEIRLDRWGSLPLRSAPFSIEGNGGHLVRVRLGAEAAEVDLDGERILGFAGDLGDLATPEFKENHIGGTAAVEYWRGGPGGGRPDLAP